uniref:Uncharacterized protein n=1 Tax=Tanacetum cinerariifolium TaxID=118510 RepID=A0A699TI46_TANCI|nr:hypothetical protein [Tanacetum cinerariifolium]
MAALIKRKKQALVEKLAKERRNRPMTQSTEAPSPYVPDVPQLPVVSSPPSSGTRRKSLGRKHLPKPKSTL